MLRRETFSIWPVLLGLAAVTVVGVAHVVTRTMCGGPSKTRTAEVIVDEAAHLRYPAWLMAHDGCPRFSGAVLDEPVDPWGRPYRVVCVDHPPRIAITSAGEDGRFGTGDDISSLGGTR
jgi:Type II secretion system (T2SS), protein G